MARNPNHRGGLLSAFVVGEVVGSRRNKTRRDRRTSDRLHPSSPGLDARQAMTAASIAQIIGLIAMAVFLGFYAYTMWHL